VKKKSRAEPATMADIARLAGVSASTVSRALAGSTLVARKKREEITRLARERGYVINATARNLRLQRTQTLSVVIPLGHDVSQPLTDPFLMEMLSHLADSITQRGYGMLLQKIVPPMGDWLPQLIVGRKSDGIIVIGQSTEHAALEAAAADYKPLVVWGGHLARQSYCTVGSDNVGGALAAVEHLIQRGRRWIVFLGDPAEPEIGLRYAGYRLAHERAPHLRSPPHIVPAHLSADAAYEAMRTFIGAAERFDAVFAATDLTAISAVRAITAAGLSVPRDVAVVGFDDITLAAHTNPPLTTVRQDLRRGAATLVDLLFRRMEGENAPSVMLPAQLVLRESSG
jgi:DNA-binding LacI/PurR family transcriptional regulator